MQPISYFTDFHRLSPTTSIEVLIAHLDGGGAKGRACSHDQSVFVLNRLSGVKQEDWAGTKRLLKLAERSCSPVILNGFEAEDNGFLQELLTLQVPIVSLGRAWPMADAMLAEADFSLQALSSKLDELFGMNLEALLSRRTGRFLAQGQAVKGNAVLAEIRPAHSDEVGRILDFLPPFVAKKQILPRSEAELKESLSNILVAMRADTDELIGTVALRDFGGGLFEVRSLTVSPDYEGQGLGTRLIKEAVAHAKTQGAKRIFTLTMRQGLFQRCGFSQVCIMRFPGKVQVDCMNCPKKEYCDEVALSLDV